MIQWLFDQNDTRRETDQARARFLDRLASGRAVGQVDRAASAR